LLATGFLGGCSVVANGAPGQNRPLRQQRPSPPRPNRMIEMNSDRAA
jgi:hypothetical protein